MGKAALDIDHPFLAPGRLDLDAVVIHRDDFQAEPLVIRRAGDQRLHLLQRQIGGLGHQSSSTMARMGEASTPIILSGSATSVTRFLLMAPRFFRYGIVTTPASWNRREVLNTTLELGASAP